MELRQETQLAVQRRSQSPTYTTTLRLYPNTTSNEPSVLQSETYNGDTSYPIISYHHISIASRANKKWLSSHNGDINQSVQHEQANTWSHQWPVPELTSVQPITTPNSRLCYLSDKFAPGITAALQELIGGKIAEVLPSLQNIFVEELSFQLAHIGGATVIDRCPLLLRSFLVVCDIFISPCALAFETSVMLFCWH